MLSIDREVARPVFEQLAEQLRYQIRSGQMRAGQVLPSTRALAEQLGVSFHTVRKAYQTLAREGLVDARSGRGYRVREQAPQGKAERMEHGAAAVQEVLRRLVGLGLEAGEIEGLFLEQLTLLEHERAAAKVVFAAPFREMAERGAEQLAATLQQPVEASTLAALGRHADADVVFAPYPDLPQARAQAPRADVHGAAVIVNREALERLSRLLDHETLGLVTRYADAVQPLLAYLRAASGFAGHMMAVSIEERADHLSTLTEQVDLLLYTAPCRRKLRPLLGEAPPHAPVDLLLTPDTLEAARAAVPT